MKLRVLYALTGGLAGLLLGAVVAFSVIAIGAGVSWIFLYGDDPWPAGSAWILPSLGLVAGLSVLCGLLALGFVYGWRQESAMDQTKAYRQAYALLGLVLLLMMATGAGLSWRHQEDTQARATSAQQEAAFRDLLLQRQRIIAADFQPATRPEEISLRVTTQGQSAGRYRLGWNIEYSLYNATLLENTREVSLERGSNKIEVRLDQNIIAQSFRKAVLKGPPGAVLIDQNFDGQFWLEPLLSAIQEADLPPREIQNLSLGYSELRDHREIEVPVRFKILTNGDVIF